MESGDGGREARIDEQHYALAALRFQSVPGDNTPRPSARTSRCSREPAHADSDRAHAAGPQGRADEGIRAAPATIPAGSASAVKTAFFEAQGPGLKKIYRERRAGDILEVRILDVRPRPSCKRAMPGAASVRTPPLPGVSLSRPDRGAEAAPKSSRSSNSIPPASRSPRRSTIMSGHRRRIRTASCIRRSDYPGVRVDHGLVRKRENILPNIKVPARLHFGTMALRRRNPIS